VNERKNREKENRIDKKDTKKPSPLGSLLASHKRAMAHTFSNKIAGRIIYLLFH
jgi:hypothetical protein